MASVINNMKPITSCYNRFDDTKNFGIGVKLINPFPVVCPSVHLSVNTITQKRDKSIRDEQYWSIGSLVRRIHFVNR